MDYDNPHVIACEISHGAEEHGAQNGDFGLTQADLTHALAIAIDKLSDEQLNACLEEWAGEMDVEIEERLRPIRQRRGLI